MRYEAWWELREIHHKRGCFLIRKLREALKLEKYWQYFLKYFWRYYCKTTIKKVRRVILNLSIVEFKNKFYDTISSIDVLDTKPVKFATSGTKNKNEGQEKVKKLQNWTYLKCWSSQNRVLKKKENFCIPWPSWQTFSIRKAASVDFSPFKNLYFHQSWSNSIQKISMWIPNKFLWNW